MLLQRIFLGIPNLPLHWWSRPNGTPQPIKRVQVAPGISKLLRKARANVNCASALYVNTVLCWFLGSQYLASQTLEVKMNNHIISYCSFLERTRQSSKKQLKLSSMGKTLRVRSKCFNSKRANEVPKSRIYLVLKGLLAWASNHSKAVYYVYCGWGSGANTKQHISCSKRQFVDTSGRREGLACIHRFWTELWKSSCGLREWHLTEWHP